MAKKIKTKEERKQEVIDAYKKAYKLVYGVLPCVTVDGEYIRVTGQSVGVTLTRLKTMTTMLINAHRNLDYTTSSSKSPSRPIRMFRH